mgnify:CR=1 FL=1
MTHESQFPTEPGHEGNSAEEEPKWNPSESQDYPVSCPNCGKETPFVLWVMLNTKENPEECGVCVIRYEFDESEADDIQLVMTDGVSGGTTGHFHQAID